jgi:hypothetical protein
MHRLTSSQQNGHNDRKSSCFERLTIRKPPEHQRQNESNLGRKARIFAVASIIGKRCQAKHPGSCDAQQS